MSIRKIDFSPPDITNAEINEVIDALKSGWITTGPKTKLFEKNISDYCNSSKTVCLNSATACLELILRLFDIKKGDEVITTPYTFASTANVIIHVGAKPVFVDVKKESFNIDPQAIKKALSKKTKAVIPVDIAGWPCDYDEIKEVLDNFKFYHPDRKTKQALLDRPLIVADSAHSFGAEYKGKKLGTIADFTCFSFHAVKNLTTAEGGAVTFNGYKNYSSDEIYNDLMKLSLHGQSKDAYAKMKTGGWKYDIKCAGFKYNMTDIASSVGLAQLRRYDQMLNIRERLFNCYNEKLNFDNFILPPFNDKNKKNSFHLYPLRIKNFNEENRNKLIEKLANAGISTNVHFIPVVMHSFYKKLGYSIKYFPNCYEMYKNEITLPLYSKLTLNDINYISDNLIKIFKK
ncbi:MAG: DegT/DnrJ/EryC1/StrS family aminotransferase [Spirochaetes bacterium]|nr:DegT/DnrJ/EryC1/StrS family aminotransferase [Spirochaetota bacterium]